MPDPAEVVRSRPVADQVTDILRERILDGFYPTDQRMPSEAQLAEDFKVSRSSIRTALAGLAAEGQLRRRHGDGTYPCPPTFRILLRTGNDWDVERQIAASGRKPGMRVLECAPRAASRAEAAALGLEPGGRVLSIKRLFSADGKAVGLVSSVIDAKGLAPSLPPDAAGLPPHKFLELYHERKPRDGELRFLAIPADRELAELLGPAKGRPILVIEGRYLDETRRPLFLVRESYRGEEGFAMKTSPGS